MIQCMKYEPVNCSDKLGDLLYLLPCECFEYHIDYVDGGIFGRVLIIGTRNVYFKSSPWLQPVCVSIQCDNSSRRAKIKDL